MAKILLVHGMSEEKRTHETVLAKMRRAVLGALKGAAPEGAAPRLLEKDIALVYWGDLLRGADDIPAAREKSVSLDIQEWYTDYLRGMIRAIDRRVDYNSLGNPTTGAAKAVHGFVYQTAQYMGNAPALQIEAEAGPSLYEQVQAKFHAALAPDTRMVIGHSLGSVIAYEGMCTAERGHAVRTLLTMGSPIGTPRLIYDRLRPPLQRGRRPWPGVHRWINVTAAQDWRTAPVPRITDLFAGGVEDHVVSHGSSGFPGWAHSFKKYCSHRVVREALLEAVGPDPTEPDEAASKRYYLGVGVGAPFADRSAGAGRLSVEEDLTNMKKAFVGCLGYEPVPLDLPPWSPDREPSASSFVKALEAWLGQARLGPQNTLAIYFTGHGHCSPVGRHYLCFTGFDERNPTQNSLQPEALANLIIDRVSRAGQLWLIFDCCYAGAASAAASDIFKHAVSRTDGLTAWLTAACGPFHPGYDGVFSRAFLGAVGDARDLSELNKAIETLLGTSAPQRVHNIAFLAGGGNNLLGRTGAAPAPTSSASHSTAAQVRPHPAVAAAAPRRPRSRLRSLAYMSLASMIVAVAIAIVVSKGPHPHRPPLWVPTPSRQTDVAAAPPGMVRVEGRSINLGIPDAEAQQLFRDCRAVRGRACGSAFERSIFAREIRNEGMPPVAVASFFLDRTEVTNRAYVDWLNENRSSFKPEGLRRAGEDGTTDIDWIVTDARGERLAAVRMSHTPRSIAPIRYEGGGYLVDGAWAERPVTFVTWLGANRFCLDRHKRLPSEEEWELAARGSAGHRYPWGDAQPDTCAKSVFGRGRDGACRTEIPGPAPVATSTGDVTPQGVRDLAGNVAEWTASFYRGVDAGPPCPVRPGEVCRVVRGGGFLDDPFFLRGSARTRLPSSALARDVGFRCALDPEGPT